MFSLSFITGAVNQDGMGAVNKGDLHKPFGASCCNVAHFKKWCQRRYFGVIDFSMLQSLSDELAKLAALQYGRAIQRKMFIKWESYSVTREEMMTFVSPDEATTALVVHTLTLSDTSHLPNTCIPCRKEDATVHDLQHRGVYS
eukprot:4138040-Ditylum_brightwellii.AAC.1